MNSGQPVKRALRDPFDQRRYSWGSLGAGGKGAGCRRQVAVDPMGWERAVRTTRRRAGRDCWQHAAAAPGHPRFSFF